MTRQMTVGNSRSSSALTEWIGGDVERSKLTDWAALDFGACWLFVSRTVSDDTDDDGGTFRATPVALEQHLNGVYQRTRRTAENLGLPATLVADLALAARLHDLGKLDARFQRLLAREPGQPPLGKSGRGWLQRRQAAFASDYPHGERHESLSVELIVRRKLHAEAHDSELVEHLVASHHGWSRPFTRRAAGRAVVSDSILGVTFDETLEHCEASRAPARFQRVQERYGWLGLAWLESILQLADQRQSEAEETGQIAESGGDH